MAFYKVTYNERYGFATVHNYGCTFKCPICSYKLRSGPDGKPGFAYPKPTRYLSVEEIEEALTSVNPKHVNFMGGEPTVSKELGTILEFCKKNLNAETALGHTNGCNLDIENLDMANVGLKAWDEETHMKMTGMSKNTIYNSVLRGSERGIKINANIIYIPDEVDLDQIEAVAEWVSHLKDSSFHIMGYIPVPGQPYRRPTSDDMLKAQSVAEKYFNHVGYSHLSVEEAISLDRDDDRFDVKVIAGFGNATSGVIDRPVTESPSA